MAFPSIESSHSKTAFGLIPVFTDHSVHSKGRNSANRQVYIQTNVMNFNKGVFLFFIFQEVSYVWMEENTSGNNDINTSVLLE